MPRSLSRSSLALWSFLRLLDTAEPRRTAWFFLLYISLACGLLLKGLIAVVFPVAIASIYLLMTREVSVTRTGKAPPALLRCRTGPA